VRADSKRLLPSAVKFALWVVFPALIFTPASAQNPDGSAGTTFHSQVTEIRVTFSTTDQHNRIVANVQPTDFAIVDQDRVIRDFRSFTRSEYTRLNVAVLVDASDSIKPRFRQELSDVMQLLGETSGVPEDSFSVVSFRGLKPTLLCQGNCRALDLGAQFPSVNGGLTPLYDSIVFASRLLGQANNVHTRKILVLFTDGADTISVGSLHDALDAALDNDVAIYSVDVSPAPHLRSGSGVLRGFAASSGGRYFTAEAGTGKLVDAILEDFRAAYTVAYKLPTPAEGFHQLRILPTHDSGLQFHCRLGYYYSNKF
jgi:Ca-activated chloride channel family protein